MKKYDVKVYRKAIVEECVIITVQATSEDDAIIAVINGEQDDWNEKSSETVDAEWVSITDWEATEV